MVRTQIQLSEEQHKLLRQLSEIQHVSVAHIIRECIDSYVKQASASSRDEIVKRAIAVIGKFSSPETDISTNHDKYLAESFAGK